jgi:CRP/FNR family cyclic AMP-dependent transcriptional regulator
VLLEGSVEVEPKGRAASNMSKGDFFGEMALVSSKPRNATVTSTSAVRALVIRDLEFKTLLQGTPKIALKVLETFAARMPEGA